MRHFFCLARQTGLTPEVLQLLQICVCILYVRVCVYSIYTPTLAEVLQLLQICVCILHVRVCVYIIYTPTLAESVAAVADMCEYMICTCLCIYHTYTDSRRDVAAVADMCVYITCVCVYIYHIYALIMHYDMSHVYVTSPDSCR